jgi:hypothetical protein
MAAEIASAEIAPAAFAARSYSEEITENIRIEEV